MWEDMYFLNIFIKWDFFGGLFSETCQHPSCIVSCPQCTEKNETLLPLKIR